MFAGRRCSVDARADAGCSCRRHADGNNTADSAARAIPAVDHSSLPPQVPVAAGDDFLATELGSDDSQEAVAESIQLDTESDEEGAGSAGGTRGCDGGGGGEGGNACRCMCRGISSKTLLTPKAFEANACAYTSTLQLFALVLCFDLFVWFVKVMKSSHIHSKSLFVQLATMSTNVHTSLFCPC